jgi:hypothetical protein
MLKDFLLILWFYWQILVQDLEKIWKEAIRNYFSIKPLQ